MTAEEYLTIKGVWHHVDMVTVGRSQLIKMLDEYAKTSKQIEIKRQCDKCPWQGSHGRTCAKNCPDTEW